MLLEPIQFLTIMQGTQPPLLLANSNPPKELRRAPESATLTQPFLLEGPVYHTAA